MVIGLSCIDLGFALWPFTPSKVLVPLPEFLVQPGISRIVFDVVVLSVAGAVLVVPTSAALQTWPKPERRARTIAGASALGAALIFVDGSALAAAQKLGLSIPNAMFAIAVVNLIAAVIM